MTIDNYTVWNRHNNSSEKWPPLEDTLKIVDCQTQPDKFQQWLKRLKSILY